MKLHRILYKVCLTKKEAEKELNKLLLKIPTSFIEESADSGHWIVYLFASESEKQTKENLQFYKKEGLQIFYQYK